MTSEQIARAGVPVDRTKAVEVAKDVLKHLQDYQLVRGTYLEGYLTDVDGPWTGDLQQHLPAVEAECKMCALGACLLSRARVYDEVPAGEVVQYHPEAPSIKMVVSMGRLEIEKKLKGIFTEMDLAKIESAFEMNMMGEDAAETEGDWDELRGAVMFGLENDLDASHRVKAVMENIIANGGTFVVEPCTEEDYEGPGTDDYDGDDDEDEDYDDEEEEEEEEDEEE